MDASLLVYENRCELASLVRSLRALVNPTGFERYDCRGLLEATPGTFESNKVHPATAERLRLHFYSSDSQTYIGSRIYHEPGTLLQVPNDSMRPARMNHTGKYCSTIDFVINNFYAGARVDRAFERLSEQISLGYQGRFRMTVGYAFPGIKLKESEEETFVQMNRPHLIFSFDHAKQEILVDGTAKIVGELRGRVA